MARPEDAQLAFHENAIAAASTIINRCKNLVYLVNDPEALPLIVEVLHKAQFIRVAHINRMRQLKGEPLMTSQTQTQDPFAAALDPELPPNTIYGQALFDTWFVVLEKGRGKVVFDETQHSLNQRRTAVKVEIVPLPETGLNFTNVRDFIAEFAGDGWKQVTLPSLKHLGITNIRTQIHEHYCSVEMVAYGTYEKNGQTKDLTAPRFRQIFADRDACLNAWQDRGTRTVEEVNAELFGRGAEAAPSTPNGGPGGVGAPPATNRATMAKFLNAIVRQCRKGNDVDLDTLAARLAESPHLSQHFDVTSPEVIEAVTAVEKEVPF